MKKTVKVTGEIKAIVSIVELNMRPPKGWLWCGSLLKLGRQNFAPVCESRYYSP